MNKIWTKIKEWEYSFLALAFLIPVALLWLIFISIEVYPFGENSVLVLDLNGQYVYYFEAFRDIITDGGSLLYSWGRALGGEFLGIFAYYLSSPFSFIVALYPKGMITEALLTIVLLKVGCCGATMAFYLHKRVQTGHTKKIVFSVLYALSAYVVVFGHNVMWLDAVIWLPVLTYALEELIKKGRFKLFVVSLAMAVMANFYIGYMICIYVVIYFFYWYFANNENGGNNFRNERNHFFKALGRTALYSFIAVAIAAWIILPTWYSLKFGKTTFSDPSYDLAQKFDFLELITKFLYGSYDTVRPEGLPQVYCGILTLLLAPLYFFAKKIGAREKIFSAVLILVLTLSFNGSIIDLFWHGMQRPNWLNYRYSFMLIFFLLVLSCKALEAIGQIDFKWAAVIGGIWCALIFVIQALDYEHLDDITSIWPSFVLIVIFLIVLYSIKHEWLGHGAVLILAVIVFVETFTAGLLNVNALDEDVVISTRTSYVSYIEKYTPIFSEIQESDTSFYRMEKTDHRKTNDPFAFNIKGLSNSTSTLNAAQIDFLYKLGYSSKSHWSKYLGGNPVSDSLMGLKYIVYNDKNV
ncbi:MAG: YfhO family protein, partial [Clostridia bacterium]|nr:YfhO family protein [Clostridia bacterium]